MRTIILAGLFLGMVLTSAPGAEAAGRPNVILIIADDMAPDDCGAYGHPGVRTPHIDALARGGMRFDRAFVTASSCSPSRSSIITGRYPHSTGAEELHQPLPPEQITFVEKLKASGYWTAAAGKWHLGDAVKGRFDLVREAGASGFQLPTGPASGRPWWPRVRGRCRAGATSGCPCSGTGPAIGPSSSGWPPWTPTGTTRRGPSPGRTARRTRSSRLISRMSPKSARTWRCTTTRSPGWITTSAR